MLDIRTSFSFFNPRCDSPSKRTGARISLRQNSADLSGVTSVYSAGSEARPIGWQDSGRPGVEYHHPMIQVTEGPAGQLGPLPGTTDQSQGFWAEPRPGVFQ